MKPIVILSPDKQADRANKTNQRIYSDLVTANYIYLLRSTYNNSTKSLKQ